jgi:hypothetical protein
MKRRLAALLSAGLLASPSMAQTMVPKLDQAGRKGDVARLAKQKAQERFAGLDQDNDERLSRLEVEQDSAYLTDKFPQRDLNGDGFLSWEEFVGHNRWEK